MLTGLAVCAECQTPLDLDSEYNRRVRFYRCGRRKRSGDCGNRASIAREEIEFKVIQYVRDVLFSDDNIEKILSDAKKEKPRIEAGLNRALTELEKEIARYVKAIGKGDPPDAILDALRKAEQRKAVLQAEQKIQA